MKELLELQKEIKIKMEAYEDIMQSDYCDMPPLDSYIQGKIDALREINEKINSIICNS